MTLRISGISSDECTGFWRGGVDANGQPALVRAAEGPANPCRHCLRLIPAGEKKLVLAYRPFAGLHPYAETGPIFLHAEPCERYRADAVPTWFDFLDPAIVRGYGRDDWIRYETGSVVRGTEITGRLREDPRRSRSRLRPRPIEVQLLPVPSGSRVNGSSACSMRRGLRIPRPGADRRSCQRIGENASVEICGTLEVRAAEHDLMKGSIDHSGAPLRRRSRLK